jgi:hypothetical protein
MFSRRPRSPIGIPSGDRSGNSPMRQKYKMIQLQLSFDFKEKYNPKPTLKPKPILNSEFYILNSVFLLPPTHSFKCKSK